MELGIYLTRVLFGNISKQQEPRSHVQLCTHSDNVFPVYIKSRLVLTLAILTVLLNVVTLKALLALQEQGYGTWQLLDDVDGQTTAGVFSSPGYKQKYLPFPDVAPTKHKRHALQVSSNVGNTCSLSSVEIIRLAVPEIFLREGRSVPGWFPL